MKPLICLFLLSIVLRFATQDEINCGEYKMMAVYYSTKCCSLTFPENDPKYVSCHAMYSKFADRPEDKLESRERIAINICSHECSLLKKGILSAKYRNELDSDSIDSYFQSQYPTNPVFSTYMIDTFQKCIMFDSLGEVNIKYPNTTFIKRTCDPLAARIMMCVRTKAMQSCPSSAWSTESLECGAAKLYFKSCVGSIEKVVRTMD